MTNDLLLIKAIFNLSPSAKFRVRGVDLSTLTWSAAHEGYKPTVAEIEAEFNRLVASKPAEDLAERKRIAYAQESDPLFFKWQAEEATKEDWISKRAEIKARFSEA